MCSLNYIPLEMRVGHIPSVHTLVPNLGSGLQSCVVMLDCVDHGYI